MSNHRESQILPNNFIHRDCFCSSMDTLKPQLFPLFALLLTHLILFRSSIICDAQTLFVFGDGLYDAGNKQFLAANQVSANSLPYGSSVGKPTGRWSDGLIVPDYLCEFLGIGQIPPILHNSADFSHGASFAISDATVLGSPPETMTLSQQVMKFNENKNKWNEKARSEAIYLFYIGSNDYLSYAKMNPIPSDDQKQAFVDKIITTIDATLKAIYGAGGRKFAFQNLAPLGCLPIVKQENGYEKECVNLPSSLAELHNKKLLQLLGTLARDLKGFQYSLYDFFSSIQKRVAKPKTYAFEKGDVACCGSGLQRASGCTVNNVCTNPDAYVFFDGKHLTQKTNSEIGHLIWGANTNVIKPNNLRELFVLPLDIPVTLGAIAMNETTESMIMNQNGYGVRLVEWGTDSQWPFQADKAY